MSRLINRFIQTRSAGLTALAVLLRSGLTAALVAVMSGCAMQPRIATSFWRIGTPADSTKAGYAVLREGKKVRHCYPVTEWADTTDTQSPKDTYHSFHHHGVAIESEHMAYRIYFDKKQTIDPYCKRTPRLELAQSYWYPHDSLLAAHYGDDILRVSGTVGVGSVKYWNGKMRHMDKVACRSQRIVSATRNSATIEVADYGWEVPQSYSPKDGLTAESGQCIDLSVRYTMKAGHRDMRCDVWCSSSLDSLPQGEKEVGLCTGVQTIPAKGANNQSSIVTYNLPNGTLLASFGTDWPVNDSVKYAKETVGIAVFIPKAYAGKIVQDKSNNLCLLNLTGTSSVGLTAKRSNSATVQQSEGRSEMCHAHFYLTCVGATKEDHPVATSATEWFAYLRRWAKNLK